MSTGKKKLFLFVERPDGRDGEFWDWESNKFAVHLPGDGTLIIQRRDRPENAAVYSSVGWSSYRWMRVEEDKIGPRGRPDLMLP